MIRIDTIWLALGASDLRGGIDRLLAMVVHGFALGAQAHHAYVFANRRADRLKVLVYDGAGLWLCTRRLQAGIHLVSLVDCRDTRFAASSPHGKMGWRNAYFPETTSSEAVLRAQRHVEHSITIRMRPANPS